jgi:hypothetical protein
VAGPTAAAWSGVWGAASAGRGAPAQGERWGCDEAVGVQHAEQRDLHEEAPGGELVNGQVAMGDVAGDDAGVVGSTRRARLASA